MLIGFLLITTADVTSSSPSSHNEIQMGTTIVAAKFKDGVVVGADSRTSVSGYVSNRFASKITFVLDPRDDERAVGWDEQRRNQNKDEEEEDDILSTCCICRSGSAADTQRVAEIVRETLYSRNIRSHGLRPGTVTNVAQCVRQVLLQNPALSCSLIVAGYDHEDKRGVIYTVNPGGSMMEHGDDDVALMGSGSMGIMGYVDNHNRNAGSTPTFGCNVDEETCVSFVSNAIQLAINRDGSSGGDILMYVIDKFGKHKILQTPSLSKNAKDHKNKNLPLSSTLEGFAPPKSQIV